MANQSWINWGGSDKKKRKLNPWEQYTGNMGWSAMNTPTNTLYGSENIGIDRGPVETVGVGTKPGGKPSILTEAGGTSEYATPGATTTYPAPGVSRTPAAADTSWKDWWEGTGLPGVYNANWQITPGAEESQAQTAAFLSWINAMMPYLSASDRTTYAQQAVTALDAIDDPNAVAYWQGLANQLAPMSNQYNNELNDYWNRERLREMRRANREFWTDYSGGEGTSTEWENEGRIINSLLDAILGPQVAGGTAGSIWDQNGPMSRRERQNYQNTVENYLGGMDEGAYGALLQSMLYPTVGAPRLNAYFRAPTSSWSAPTGYGYSYASQNPRYI